ncbi:recombination protein RecO [Hydrogenimonas sp.]
MQGFILEVKKARNEDCIVSVLTPEKVKTLYRFYGARHPIVTAGYKIDFEAEYDSLQFMPKLRNITHLGFPWLSDPERMRVWQSFVTLLYRHLKDVDLPGPFYFETLERSAAVWHRQNPKRSAVEAYLRLLQHEGRLHLPDTCFACGKELQERTALVRAFLPAHPRCVIAGTLETSALRSAMESLSTIELEDDAVETMWLTMCEGL